MLNSKTPVEIVSLHPVFLKMQFAGVFVLLVFNLHDMKNCWFNFSESWSISLTNR